MEGKWNTQRKYRSNWLPSLSLGDVLWHQAIVTSKFLYEERREKIQGSNEKVLYDLLCFGTSDFSELDRPNDVATWAGRYSSVLADRLWSLVEEERAKVCHGFSRGCKANSFG